MGRARLRPGEIGVPGAKQINKDRWDACARFGASDGRPVRIERTGRTKAIAIRAVQEAAAARVEGWRLDGEAAAENAVPTVGQLAEDWFRSIEPPKVEVNQSGNAVEASFDTSVRRQTFDQYQSTYRNHIEAELGQLKVSDVGVKVGRSVVLQPSSKYQAATKEKSETKGAERTFTRRGAVGCAVMAKPAGHFCAPE
ncbi:hypothetical protein [Arthrobacter sp. 260]|uniref:hypothetical protein n=1 Tax=Arthrobacter sp. 260 TaxID=2735314 RepID=UPI003209FACB